VPLYLYHPLLLTANTANKPSICACAVPTTLYRNLRKKNHLYKPITYLLLHSTYCDLQCHYRENFKCRAGESSSPGRGSKKPLSCQPNPNSRNLDTKPQSSSLPFNPSLQDYLGGMYTCKRPELEEFFTTTILVFVKPHHICCRRGRTIPVKVRQGGCFGGGCTIDSRKRPEEL
jgi:hypothetical protein